MPAELLNFHYKGISLGKYVEGDIEALNDADAAHKLKEQKVIITKLTKEKKKLSLQIKRKKVKVFLLVQE
jgi:type IV pilus assembly protein PilC